jgi:hypothetical protein
MKSLLFQCIATIKEHIKIKASFNSITVATVIMLTHKAQNSLTVNYHHTYHGSGYNTHIHRYYRIGKNPYNSTL